MGCSASHGETCAYVRKGAELVGRPVQRRIEERKHMANDSGGFWRCVDTFKDLQSLEQLYSQGKAPWAVWHSDPAPSAPPTSSSGSAIRMT